MARNEPFPHIPADLIEALDTLFPLRAPDITWADRQIWVEVGQRRIVDFLREKLRVQEANIMETP